jgi:hypothetical protein
VPTQHDQPLRLLHTFRVSLRVAERLPLCVLGLLDLALRAVSNKDGLASPLDNDLLLSASVAPEDTSGIETHVLALGDGSEIDLNLGLGQDIGRGGHVDEEVWRANSLAFVSVIAIRLHPIRKIANCSPGAPCIS